MMTIINKNRITNWYFFFMWKIHLQAMKISGLDFSCCSPSMMQWRRFRHSESTNNNNVFFFVLICLCCDYLFFMSFWRFWTPHHQEEYCDFVPKCFSFTVTKYYEMSCCCWLFIFFSNNIIKFDFRAAGGGLKTDFLFHRGGNTWERLGGSFVFILRWKMRNNCR